MSTLYNTLLLFDSLYTHRYEPAIDYQRSLDNLRNNVNKLNEQDRRKFHDTLSKYNQSIDYQHEQPRVIDVLLAGQLKHFGQLDRDCTSQVINSIFEEDKCQYSVYKGTTRINNSNSDQAIVITKEGVSIEYERYLASQGIIRYQIATPIGQGYVLSEWQYCSLSTTVSKQPSNSESSDFQYGYILVLILFVIIVSWKVIPKWKSGNG